MGAGVTEEANRDRARALVSAHCMNAVRILTDEIVAALLAGDDAAVPVLYQQLFYAERMIERAELRQT